MSPRALAAALLLIATVVFSGCIAQGPGDTDTAPDPTDCTGDSDGCVPATFKSTDGRDLRTDLTADDEVPAPDWDIGDVFEVHFYFGSGDTSGEHIQTMVVEETASEWVLATTSATAAKDEATWDYPVLGGIDKKSLGTSGFGVPWGWMYQFPLSDGQTWTAEVEFINFNTFSSETHDASFLATYAAAIDTPHGDYPGIEIAATTEAGTLIEYNYVPAIQWFSHLWVYDQTTDDPDDVFFHAMSMGVSDGYTGEYHLYEGKEAWNNGFGTVPIAALGGEVPPASVPPTETFAVDEGASYLRGIMVSFVVGGSSILRLDLPDMTDVSVQAYHHEADPEGFGLAHEFIEIPAQAGEHRMSNVGAGLVWGAGGVLMQITEGVYELTA